MTGDPQRHCVVFDCNIYLDVARLTGPPYAWEKFNAIAAQLCNVPVPHPANGAFDSLRAVAACTSGRFAAEELLEVWTSSHIDAIVRAKAVQAAEPDPGTGSRGLGWSHSDGQSLIDELVAGLTSRSDGGTVGRHVPDGNPPLDFEDGMVFGACRILVSDDPLARVYCVTRDRGFLAAYANDQLGTNTVVMTPGKFVQLTRLARSKYSISRMRSN